MSYTYYRRYQPNRRKRRPSQFGSFFLLVIILLILALLSWGVYNFFSNLKEEQRNEASFSVERGSAQIQLWGQEHSKTASSLQTVHVGDQIVTSEASLSTFTLHNGSTLRLDESTHLVFESFEQDGSDDFVTLRLLSGRAWVQNWPKESGRMQLLLSTDVMDMQSYTGEYLVSNVANEEYLAVMEGSVKVEYVDRTGETVVVDSLSVSAGSISYFDDVKERQFLQRSAVVLAGPLEEDFFEEDAFVAINEGEVVIIEEEPEVEEEVEVVVEEPEPQPEPEASVETLAIAVVSPASGSVINKDAIAIEGRIVSGEASRVSVTWSGSGDAYDLGLFEAGSDSFRYVADVNYSNFAEGKNVYSIVAYDEDGQVSNTLLIEITYEPIE